MWIWIANVICWAAVWAVYRLPDKDPELTRDMSNDSF